MSRAAHKVTAHPLFNLEWLFFSTSAEFSARNRKLNECRATHICQARLTLCKLNVTQIKHFANLWKLFQRKIDFYGECSCLHRYSPHIGQMWVFAMTSWPRLAQLTLVSPTTEWKYMQGNSEEEWPSLKIWMKILLLYYQCTKSESSKPHESKGLNHLKTPSPHQKEFLTL